MNYQNLTAIIKLQKRIEEYLMTNDQYIEYLKIRKALNMEGAGRPRGGSHSLFDFLSFAEAIIYCDDKLKENRQILADLLTHKEAARATKEKKADRDLLISFIDEAIGIVTKDISRLKRLKRIAQGDAQQETLDIEAAKAVPIGQIMTSNGFQEAKRSQGKVFFKSPFREEQDASFCWNVDQNYYFDFGSSEAGDAIALLMQLTGLPFREAVKHLNGIY